MALEAFLNSNGAGGILEALSSHTSMKNEEHLASLLNTNLSSDVVNSKILGKFSTSSGAHLMPFSSKNPVNDFSSDDTSSHLRQGGQKERKKQQLKNTKSCTDLLKTNVQTCQDSLPVRIKQDPVLKKPRLSVNQEITHHHHNQQQQEEEIMRELYLKELQNRNPQLTAMIQQYRQQNQLQHPILNSSPHLRGFHLQPPNQQMRNVLEDQGNQRVTFAPLLDGAICSRRLKQYLYHLRNNIHDNGIDYWKKFVSEYYAPGAKKRWCFSKYENIELHTSGVFCPISMETWYCDICGSKSGKGLEATSDIFPKLFKIKFDSGVLDEILFLDSPRACKIPCGLVLEYGKATQESVYENFRVVHEGTLRVVFRYDLKILSWEFCAQNHEEFLVRRSITSQVNQLAHVAEKFQSDFLNDPSCRVSPEDFQPIWDMFVSAGNQLARNMELPLVNDLGYPKRFIRCLQIAEVVDSMTDLMALSRGSKMGPIECLNKYSQGSNIRNHMEEKQETEIFASTSHSTLPAFPAKSDPGNSSSNFVNLNHQSVSRNGLRTSLTDHPNRPNDFARYLNSEPSRTHARNPEAFSVDKLLNEMVNNGLDYGESSNGNATRAVDFCKSATSSSDGRNISVNAEQYLQEQLPEAFRSSGAGFSNIQDLRW